MLITGSGVINTMMFKSNYSFISSVFVLFESLYSGISQLWQEQNDI